jgi:hypothetical protein
MITEIKDIFSDIFYDWGFGYTKQEINKDSEDSYWINKTYIYKNDNDGKFYIDYKTSHQEISKKVFNKFKDFFAYYENDIKFEEFLSYFVEDCWFTNDKWFLKMDQSRINLNDKLFINIQNNRIFVKVKNKEEVELDYKLKEKIISFFKMFK